MIPAPWMPTLAAGLARQARIERLLPEALAAVARAELGPVATHDRLAETNRLAAPITAEAAGALAAEYPEIDQMTDGQLLQWLLAELRPVFATMIARAPS